MVLACVGIYAQNISGKIAPSSDLITLHGISEFFTVEELYST